MVYVKLREISPRFDGYDHWVGDDSVCWCHTTPELHLHLQQPHWSTTRRISTTSNDIERIHNGCSFAIDDVFTDCFLAILAMGHPGTPAYTSPLSPKHGIWQTWCITPYPQNIVPLYSDIIEIVWSRDQTCIDSYSLICMHKSGFST